MSDTLVLDIGYQPVQAVSWMRAMTLWYEGKAEVVTEYEDRKIRTVSVTFRMPSVIRLLKAEKNRKRAIKFSRVNLWVRDGKKCGYCGIRLPLHEVTYDHVVPRSQGGKTDWTNVVIACYSCNDKKRNRTPEQAGMRLRVQPVKPKLLPGMLVMTYKKSYPPEWRQWLVDASYWHGKLDEDK